MDYKALKLEEFELFADIARLKSVRAVARHRSYHPSRVSKTLERIEKKLDAVLLERGASGMTLTAEGSELLAVAGQVLEAASPLARRAELREAEQRMLSIGSVPFLLRSLLASRVGQAGVVTDLYRLRLVDIEPDRLMDAALAHAFEVAIHLSEAQWPDAWVTEEVGTLRWALLSAADHPLKGKVTVEEITAYPFVIPSYWQDGAYRAGADHCPLPIEERIRGHEVASASTAVELVATSRHLAFLPVIAARQAIAHGRVSEIIVESWPRIARPVFLTVRSDALLESTRTALVDWVRGGLE